MEKIGEWVRRLGFLLRRRALEDELRREMEAHRALMDDPRAFGNILRLRDESRDAWGWTWLDDFVHDTRFAFRTLRHGPGFALTAVVTLALGIGVNIGMFSLVNGLLLRPLYERTGEVVGVYSRSTAPAGGYRGISYPNYLALREATVELFADLAAVSTTFVGLDAGAGARRTLALGVTTDYFHMFGLPLALGRSFTVEEERLGGGVRVAIISHRLWEQRGADPNVLGRPVQINGEPFTVVGVAAEGFIGTSIPGPEVWLPLGASETFSPVGTPGRRPFDAREAHELTVVGRLRADASVETLAPAIATVGRRLEQAFPAVNAGYTFEAATPSRFMFFPGPGSDATTASLGLLLMVMPAIVLLVACLNLVDLLLARGQTRRQEMAIRASLGGGRGRLARQLVAEGLLLALAGGVVGLLLSTWATRVLMASVRPVLPFALSLPEIGLDWRVFVGTIGFSLLATLIFGAWPAWALTGRAAATDLKQRVVEDGRRLSGGVRGGKGLVIGQVALSILLLACGGLFLMSALSAATADPGVRFDEGLIAEIDPSLAGYDEARGRQTHLALVDRLRTVPGLDAVSIASGLPFSSSADSRLVAPSAAVDARAASVDAVFTVVGRDYARTLGLPMLGGRDFTDAELDPGSSERVAIIDDALARQLWPSDDALGQWIQFLDGPEQEVGRRIRVVGIVPAVKHSLTNAQPFPHVYVPLGQHYQSAMTLQLRAADAGAARAMLTTVASAIRSVDERVPVLRLQTWSDHLEGSVDLWLYRAGARVFTAFAGIALLLAVIGIYGVKSYVVSRRTREFGIRIAMGAHPRTVLWQVLREGGRLTAAGIGIGVLLALGAGQVLQGLLYGVRAVEPLVLIAAPVILLAASLLAGYVPALRATKVDPTVALRSE